MRMGTIRSINQLKAYDDGCGLYEIDINYNYDVERVINRGITDDQSFFEAVRKECLPFIPVKLEYRKFACTVFSMASADGKRMMGRNYDFKFDTSAMLVRCHPKNGYRSIAFSALDNLCANSPTTFSKKMACLTVPYACLDGINEKGVSVAILTLDSKPTRQYVEGKKNITPSLAVRLILDKADSTEKAVELLSKYTMYASGGRDYHYYVCDASGDCRIIEYDCNDEARSMKVTPTEAAANFYVAYIDKVLPNQHNGIYGHGKERYDAVFEVVEETRGKATEDDAWRALKASAQLPNPAEVTSNTQWSIVYNNTDRTAAICIRRHWEDVFRFKL